MQCGPIRFRITPRSGAALRPFIQSVITRTTSYKLPDDSAEPTIQQLYAGLAADEARNEAICRDVLQTLREGRTSLVLTERRDHLEVLATKLTSDVQHLVVLRGGLAAKKRRDALTQLAAIPENEPAMVLATGRYAGEGFDFPRLDTLLLALPISWRGTLQQYVGRLHRIHPTKRDVRVYDYVDAGVPVLAAMFRKRLKGYTAMGYTIATDHHEPGPAMPSQDQLAFHGRPLPIPRPLTRSMRKPKPLHINFPL